MLFKCALCLPRPTRACNSISRTTCSRYVPILETRSNPGGSSHILLREFFLDINGRDQTLLVVEIKRFALKRPEWLDSEYSTKVCFPSDVQTPYTSYAIPLICFCYSPEDTVKYKLTPRKTTKYIVTEGCQNCKIHWLFRVFTNCLGDHNDYARLMTQSEGRNRASYSKQTILQNVYCIGKHNCDSTKI